MPLPISIIYKDKKIEEDVNIPLSFNLHSPFINHALEYFFCVGKIKNQKRMVAIPDRWSKPQMGWLKLNTNGASLSNQRRAGGGRPHYGQLGQLDEGLLKIHWACHGYYS